ncbi:MAG: SIMPL domain-containing protein [Deltaproteobacteria bacterium]|nr:SIMPL domain-containing protein [Deltaproteobacteria bacterium]MBV8454787.1 SIMPL domain-containing protein [Deltaproteobacteria bacterium]
MLVIRLILFPLFILAVFPLYAGAQMPSPAPTNPLPPPAAPTFAGSRVMEVSGNSEVQAAPDLATLEIAIETHAASADQAAGLNGALAQKVRDALMSKLANKGTMWTGGYSLFPEYTEPREGKPTVSGYRAENSISVQTGELGLVGPLIDAAIGAGANRIDTLNYSLRADSKARSEAIAKAARDAQTQASALADALGVKLGPVIKASTESQVRPVPIARFASSAAMAANVQTPIAAGQVTVPATVSLTYGIE